MFVDGRLLCWPARNRKKRVPPTRVCGSIIHDDFRSPVGSDPLAGDAIDDPAAAVALPVGRARARCVSNE